MPELNNARRRRTIRADFAWKNLLVFAKRRSEYIVGLLDPASGRYRVTAIGICQIQRNIKIRPITAYAGMRSAPD
jgi:hypothetical protein